MSRTAKTPTKGVGTNATGYAGSEFGPFRCGHCVWFQHGKKSGRCHHPEVMVDPDVSKNSDGTAIVDQDGCCNHFRPTRKLDTIKFEDVGL